MDNSSDEFWVKDKLGREIKINVLGPVSAAADRLNLSSCKIAMLSAATAKVLGLSIANTNICQHSLGEGDRK